MSRRTQEKDQSRKTKEEKGQKEEVGNNGESELNVDILTAVGKLAQRNLLARHAEKT